MESKDNLKEYKMLADVLENYGELGEGVSKNPFLMIDLAELIKHPSGGLVELDEEEIRNFIIEHNKKMDNSMNACISIHPRTLAEQICQRFGQREIKYPARKNDLIGSTVTQAIATGYNDALDDIKKLNKEKLIG